MPEVNASVRPERWTLRAICIAGYVNLVGMTLMLLGLKGGPAVPGWLLAVTPAISAAGATVYYCGWQRCFPAVRKAAGRRYMRPYLLGTYLLLATVVFFVVLYAVATKPAH